MAPLRLALAALLLIPVLVSMALAHSLKEFEEQLAVNEKYFQPIEKPAPDFLLGDADGRVVRLSDFRGKVVVLHFIYTRCPDFCPLHAELIAKIQSMINRTPMKQAVSFITITTDPSEDRAAVLRDYGRKHGLDPVNWIFLTTTPDQAEDTTRRLAEAFGHKFTKTTDGFQMHGVVTHIIDREGNWRGNFHGLRFDPVNLVVFVNALVNDVHPAHEPQPATTGFWGWVREVF